MLRGATLEADPTSARVAQRFVVDVLAEWHLSDIAETAELLISELVTNAWLHAHSGAELVASLSGGTVRFEVPDTSSVLPTTGNHHRESQTGRGVELVELLADAWGVDVHHRGPGITGKGVWFELSVAGAAGSDISSAEDRATSPRGSTLWQVCLQGVPTALFRASQEHRQDLTREFVLMTIDEEASTEVPARLVALSDALLQRFGGESEDVLQQVHDAEERGDAEIDLLLELPPDAGPALVELVDLLEEADRFCEQGAMLTMAASAEIRAFRRWAVEEVVAQFAGRPATAWRRR